MADLFGGVETGGTWCVCAVARGPEEIVAREQFPTKAPAETIERIIAFFAEHPGLRALGVGSFGPVDLGPDSPTWGHVTTTPKPGWSHTALAPPLATRLDLPVAFETDVNAAAIGELTWGAGRDVASLCYLTVGTGVGGGLVIDDTPVHGLIHPEVGHLRVPRDRHRDPFPGNCPVHGDCWEGLVAGPALAERWGASPQDLPTDHPAWDLEADYLAFGVHAIISVASPERVVMGGGVMDQLGLLDKVRSRIRALNAGYLDTPLLGADIERYIVAPELGDDAGVLGAVALAQRLVA